MMRIRQIGDPILRQTSAEVPKSDFCDPDTLATITTMKAVLNGIKAISEENGNAISAPQVGSLIRLVVLRINEEFVVMLNPRIKTASAAHFDFKEECFSFYNLRASVSRASQVTVDYWDEHGNDKSITLNGEESGLIQHEIDHLNGVFFLDRVEQKDTVSSIDYELQNNPERLTTVKQMMDYMTGSGT